nr:immunoglobulin light chain junction region [Macaca mulatta]MOX24213.1 immunoglobulin light chain junction region [Macaca mulatta]MOX24364.1 immunoglobulin light chain junction region [Macaca mulatta]MOX24375.1 immunoglobulin light chain junction region [Macaca mulatta]MOX24682.1 immunoglobulin light chain junction region [Macaca mulatta]
CQQGYTIPFIF